MRVVKMLFAAMLTAAAACAGEGIDTPPNGHAVIASRSSELSVGDTMTLNPGVLYNDGRWVPLDSAKLTLVDTTHARLDTATNLMTGKSPGKATARLEIPQVGTISRQFSILP